MSSPRRTRAARRGAGVVLAASLAWGGRLAGQGDVVRTALRDELARSMQALHLDTLPGPYFVAYRVDDVTRTEVTATRGSLLRSDSMRVRRLFVEVRVGDYAFDNTNFFGIPTGDAMSFRGFGGFGELPLDDNYAEIRRQVWLATDRAYKDAVEQLARKRAAVQNLAVRDSVPNFSREPVVSTTDSTAIEPASRRMVEPLVRGLSALFRDMPDIFNSRVEWDSRVVRTTYLNSEGTAFIRVSPRVTLSVEARTPTADGSSVGDGYRVSGASLRDLPVHDSLTVLIRQLGAHVATLRTASLAEPYDGPVLFTGDAAGDLFRRLLAPQLVAARRPLVDNPMLQLMLERQSRSRVDDIGTRILPRFLSVSDDPSLRVWQGRYVGGFRVDDDGVPTHGTLLVEHGVLRTLLMTRTPIRGIARSSGNRWGAGPVISTLIVSTDSGLSDGALRQRLLDLAAARGVPYGVIVSRLGDGGATGADDPVAMMAAMADAADGAPQLTAAVAVRIYPDGREEPIRGAELVGLTGTSLKGIVAASQLQSCSSDPVDAGGVMAIEMPFGMLLGLEGEYESSYVVPAVLLDDVSIRRRPGGSSRPPLVRPPWLGPGTSRQSP